MISEISNSGSASLIGPIFTGYLVLLLIGTFLIHDGRTTTSEQESTNFLTSETKNNKRSPNLEKFLRLKIKKSNIIESYCQKQMQQKTVKKHLFEQKVRSVLGESKYSKRTPYLTALYPYGPTNQIQSSFELLQLGLFLNRTVYLQDFYPHFTDNEKAIDTITPSELILDIDKIGKYQKITFGKFGLENFKNNCLYKDTIFITSKTPVWDLVQTFDRVKSFEGLTGLKIPPRWRFQSKSFKSKSQTNLPRILDFETFINSKVMTKFYKDKCLFLIFPFQTILTKSKCESNSKAKKSCQLQSKLNPANTDNYFKLYECKECRDFSPLLKELGSLFKLAALGTSPFPVLPKFDTAIHYRFDEDDFCGIFKKYPNRTYNPDNWKYKKQIICNDLFENGFNLTVFLDKVIEKFPAGRKIYFATPNLSIIQNLKNYSEINEINPVCGEFSSSFLGCFLYKDKYQIYSITQLDLFLNKVLKIINYKHECIDKNLQNMLASNIEQYLLADAKTLIYSTQSTFSSRAVSLNLNKNNIYSIFDV